MNIALKRMVTLALFTLLATSFANEEIPKVLMEQSVQLLNHDNSKYLAISFKAAPHWHTYWKNPGDAGLPTKIEINGIQTSEMQWPVPKRYIEKGDILAYGYEKEFTRFYKVNESINGQKLSIKSTWLICKHICIPGQAEYTGTINSTHIQADKQSTLEVDRSALVQRFNNLPKKSDLPRDIDLILKKGSEENQLILFYNISNPSKKNIDKRLGLFTPYPNELFDFKREELYQDSKGNYFGKMTISWDGEYAEPSQELPVDGKFVSPITISFLYNNPTDESYSIIKKSITSFDTTGAKNFESLLATMTKVNANKMAVVDDQEETAKDPGKQEQSIFYFLLFAFIGGLILNIMPCVLPVISIKLFGLISHSNESKSNIFKHNLFYTLGVLTTFGLLAAAIIALKTTGQQVGWGFQLQSPVFISLTIIVLFVFSLNLFGLFEFATPGGKQLGNVKESKGFVGDFVGGVIATVLSTPCSAPFLGTALTFAFTSSNTTVFLIFFMIGLGLSFPFLITGIFPATIKFLPKPGMWMEHVKKFLGLTLLLTVIWLLDVFISLTTGNLPLLKLITALLFFFFAFYYQKNISKKIIWKIIFFGLPLLFCYSLYSEKMADSSATGQGSDLLSEKNSESELKWIKWSEEEMKNLAGQQKNVFIDFTAKWCFTCKVNEKLVINTNRFKELIAKYDVTLLLGDWTKYDPLIGAYLKKNGYVGVPAYFIQKPDGSLIALGETITINEIEKNLK
jgi:thiol:disulfide interchange protein DsbD